MARPSQQIDLALLHSGAQLYPQRGYARLSVRAVAEHAGVAPGMFHYHFANKQAFVAAVLQQQYEQGFALLQQQAHTQGAPLLRLHKAVCVMARFARDHRLWILRLLADAGSGVAPVQAFLRQNLPRHLQVILALLAEAEAAGDIAPQPPMARFASLMGAVVAPTLAMSHATSLGLAPPAIAALLPAQVLDDAAIEARARRAVAALRLSEAEVRAALPDAFSGEA